jgi:hypothetical protein
MIEQHAGEAQEEAWDAITRAAADFGGGSGPLRLSNAVLLAPGTAWRASARPSAGPDPIQPDRGRLIPV